MSTSSDPAVTSPWTSTTPAGPFRRTSKVAVASAISVPSYALYGAVLVGVDRHEVGQPGDLEDLAVVVGEAVRPDRDAVCPRTGEQADHECDAGRVDVAAVLETEHHGIGAHARRDGPGLVQCGLGRGVEITDQFDDRDAVPPAYVCERFTCRHRRLLPSAPVRGA